MRSSRLGNLSIPLVCLLLTLAGCSIFVDAGEDADLPLPPPAPVASGWTGCAQIRPYRQVDETYRGTDGGVPAGFDVERSVSCDTEPRTRADGAEITAAVEQTATDVDALVDALTLPSRTKIRWGNSACPAMGWIEPWLFLVDAQNRWIKPRFPMTSCHLPRPELTSALAGLRTTSVELKPVRVKTSAEADTARCNESWRDMVTSVLEEPGSLVEPQRVAGDPFGGAPIRRCVYTNDRRIWEGLFRSGGALPPTERSAVIEAMVGSPPWTGSCREIAPAFAVLQRISEEGPTAYVELGGCRRMLVTETETGSPTVSVAGPKLVRLLSSD